jgi:hypothetical protein
MPAIETCLPAPTLQGRELPRMAAIAQTPSIAMEPHMRMGSMAVFLLPTMLEDTMKVTRKTCSGVKAVGLRGTTHNTVHLNIGNLTIYVSPPVRKIDDEELDSGDDEGRKDRVVDTVESENIYGTEQDQYNIMELTLSRLAQPEKGDGEVYRAAIPSNIERIQLT